MRAGQTAYEAWAGGAAFGDGNNGMAFLFGAADPDENAIGRLPTVTETAGALIVNFNGNGEQPSWLFRSPGF